MKQKQTYSRSFKKTLFFLAGITVGLLGFAVFTVVLPESAHAAPNQVDGTVFFDQNNNGVHDPGEPGLEGLLVRFGSGGTAPQAFTDANGQYVLSGPDITGTATVEVFTGWFRSQCDEHFSCAPGPGADNDFAVMNQFIVAPGTDGDAGATLNVGLIPDWDGQGTYATFPADGTTVTGTSVDIAARASYGFGCSQGTNAERLCSPGDRIRFRFAFFNQGTEALSNPTFALQVPVGHVIDDSSWFDNGQAIPTANNITVVQSFDPALGYGIYRLNGTLPRGASSTMFVEADVTNDAIGSPQPYATSDPRDKGLVVQVLDMDQTGDWDSELCLGAAQNWLYGTCALNPLGNHNKILATDHSDGSSWNVTGVFVPRDDSMQTSLTLTDPAAPVHICGDDVNPGTVSASIQVTNTSTGDSPLRNIELAADVPAGFVFEPADNPGWFIGGDGKPHTFVNLHFLPGATVDVPLQLRVDPSVSAGDHALATAIIAYDTVQVSGDEFVPGSLSGSLIAEETITVTQASDCSGGTLAPTGSNMSGMIFAATVLVAASLLVASLPLYAYRN